MAGIASVLGTGAGALGGGAGKAVAGKAVAGMFGGAIPGLNILLALMTIKELADLFGIGPEGRKLSAAVKQQQSNLLANAMLMLDERKQRTEELSRADTIRTQQNIQDVARQAGLQELATMNLASQSVRGMGDLSSAYQQAIGLGGMTPQLPQEEAFANPLVMLNG